jgi:hypothetical protein
MVAPNSPWVLDVSACFSLKSENRVDRVGDQGTGMSPILLFSAAPIHQRSHECYTPTVQSQLAAPWVYSIHAIKNPVGVAANLSHSTVLLTNQLEQARPIR